MLTSPLAVTLEKASKETSAAAGALTIAVTRKGLSRRHLNKIYVQLKRAIEEVERADRIINGKE